MKRFGGGSVGFLAKYICNENFNISQALISDITWITEGVKKHGDGVVISSRRGTRGYRKKLR